MTLTIKLDRNWSSFQLANSAPPLSVTDSAIAPSARMLRFAADVRSQSQCVTTSLLSSAARLSQDAATRKLSSSRVEGVRRPVTLKGCAAPSFVPCQCNTGECLSKLETTSSRRKIYVTSRSPVGDISVVTLIRTDTTLDHSQKAEKVC